MPSMPIHAQPWVYAADLPINQLLSRNEYINKFHNKAKLHDNV